MTTSPSDYLNNRDLEGIHRELTGVREELQALREAAGDRLDHLERDNIYVRGFLAALLFFIGLPAVVGSGVGAFMLIRVLTGH